MKSLPTIIAALALLTTTTITASHAAFQIPDLNNTGTTGPTDTNYSYTAGLSPNPPANGVVRTAVPSPPWIPNSNTNGSPSQWISTAASGNQANDTYTWTTTFTIPNDAVLGTITLKGWWATDNGASMFLNGTTLVSTTADEAFNQWLGFTISDSATPGAFTLGANTLTFIVKNFLGNNGPGSGNPTNASPTGLRVEFDFANSTYATPEPTTLVVWSGLAAIGGIVAYRRRVAA